jgi:hypothetical protein
MIWAISSEPSAARPNSLFAHLRSPRGWSCTRRFIVLFVPLHAVFNKRKEPSMTSEVMRDNMRARGFRRISEQFLMETLHGLVRRVSGNLTNVLAD